MLRRSVLRLLFTATVVPSSPILVTLMMEAMRSSQTSVLTRVTRHNIPEDGILRLVILIVPEAVLYGYCIVLFCSEFHSNTLALYESHVCY
jgi:hypothetical protein